MGAKLQVTPSQAAPFEVSIGNTATIGRTRENTVCLNFSPLTSRQHAMIRCHNGWQYQIIDLGSRNGTFLNDQRVVMPATLEHGAKIRIADTVLTFVEEAEELGEDHLEATLADAETDTSFEARPAALMVCDIRGFSTLSEQVTSGNLAQLLGAWFRESGNVIVKSGGTIDKFLGDAVLAYWGGLGGNHCCTPALATALELQRLAAERSWGHSEPLRIATALHYGNVTCTNVGMTAERDATIIGDAVNTVFRLEHVSKELDEPVLCSHDFVQQLECAASFRDRGEQALKGKSQMVRVFGWSGSNGSAGATTVFPAT
ncbi:MAG: FHA domain-containing protein [Chthoniobacteraceae bacterium]